MTSVRLTPAFRQTLRAQAHRLEPVVMIGDNGLSESVIREIARSLAAHELIKVRVAGSDREARADMLGAICKATGAIPVQHIGKILVIYRERPASAEQPPAEATIPSAPARRRRPVPPSGLASVARTRHPPAKPVGAIAGSRRRTRSTP